MDQHPPQPSREPQAQHPDSSLLPLLTDEFINKLTNPQLKSWLCSIHPSIRKTMRKSERRQALRFWRDFSRQRKDVLREQKREDARKMASDNRTYITGASASKCINSFHVQLGNSTNNYGAHNGTNNYGAQGSPIPYGVPQMQQQPQQQRPLPPLPHLQPHGPLPRAFQAPSAFQAPPGPPGSPGSPV